MSAHFESFDVPPALPTTLKDAEWLPLPASDFSFYPAVNSYLLPGPVDADRLRNALSKTLQLFAPHCGAIARHPIHKNWQIRLLNRPVKLTIGSTDEPGPFEQGWDGDRHPDYYDELPRGNITTAHGLEAPLFCAKVTTWRATQQTAIFVSQSYALGDAFAILWFMRMWSHLYLGEAPPFIPSFEKYYLPPALVLPKPTHAADLEHISFMIADFDEQFFEERNTRIEEQTQRIDYTLDGDFVDAVWAKLQGLAPNRKISRADALSGYIVSVLQGLIDEPVDYIHQLVAMRGQNMVYNGKHVSLPMSTTGNGYMIYGCDLPNATRDICPLTIAAAMRKARKVLLSDQEKLGRTYMLYNSLYQKAVDRDRIFVDSGYREGIAINWLVEAGLTEPHFGYKGQIGHLEWESLENFVQIWKANATRQPDGSFWADPRGLQLLLRLPHDLVQPFGQRLKDDRRMLVAAPATTARL